MGKEAKVGLAVIFSLFVILGAVVTVRIISYARSAGTEVNEDAPDANEEGVVGSKEATVLAEASASAPSRKAESKAAAKETPTVLSPASPDPATGRASQWRQLAVQSSQAGTADDSAAGSATSDVPMPPRPVPDEPSGRSGRADAPPLPPDPSAGYAMAGAAEDGAQASDSRYGGRFDAPPEAGTPVRRHRYSEQDVAGGPELSPNYMPRHDTTAPAGAPARGGSGLASESDPNAGRRADGTYEVQPNDNFWTISKKLYGTGAYFRALAEHNRSKVANQNQLQVGQIVAAPDVAELEQKFPAYCPKPEHRHVARHHTASVRTATTGAEAAYTVIEGDSLYRIARYELGDASRWYEVYKLNREVIGESFNHLRPGTQLILPDKVGAEPADALTRRPGSLY